MMGDRLGTELAPWLIGLWLAVNTGQWWQLICIFLLCALLNIIQWAMTVARTRKGG